MTGHNKVNWNVSGTLQAGYWLFKDSPARRSECQDISGCEEFPLKFCPTRWVENATTATRFLKVYDGIKQYIETAKETAKPSLSSWKKLQVNFQDPFLKAKIHFFIFVANDIEPYLRRFQTNHPMAPLLYDETVRVQRSILSKFIKSSVLLDLPGNQLSEIDLDEKDNLLDVSKVSIGIGANAELKKIETAMEKKKTTVTKRAVLEFRTECRNFLKEFCLKVFQRSPIKYDVVHWISCLSPRRIHSEPEEALDLMLKLLQHLAASFWIDEVNADKAHAQFTEMVWRIQGDRTLSDKFKNWKESDSRLDQFYLEIFDGSSLANGTEEINSIIKLVLTFSHGNASVESGFSINKDMLVENQSVENLVNRRFVYDSIKAGGGALAMAKSGKIDKPLLAEVRRASSRYKSAAQEKQQDREDNGEAKRKAAKRKLEEELREIKKKKAQIEDKQAKSLEELKKRQREAEYLLSNL